MKYLTIQPSSSLSKYVRYFWILEGEAFTNTPYVHRSMADGCAELLFHYKGVFNEINLNGEEEKSFQSGLSGQSQAFRRFCIDQNFGMFGVYLYPYAVNALFPFAAPEIKNNMVDLKTLLGKEADQLEEKMMLANDHSTRFNIITKFLERKLTKSRFSSPGITETIQYIIQTKGTMNVEELAQRNFLSTRQFERKFKESSGFNPKLFSRIIRFQSILELYGASPKRMTEIAYKAGYYDQSHFIQDFKTFSGHTPLEYFSGRTESTQWKD